MVLSVLHSHLLTSDKVILHSVDGSTLELATVIIGALYGLVGFELVSPIREVGTIFVL